MALTDQVRSRWTSAALFVFWGSSMRNKWKPLMMGWKPSWNCDRQTVCPTRPYLRHDPTVLSIHLHHDWLQPTRLTIIVGCVGDDDDLVADLPKTRCRAVEADLS